MRFRDIKRNGGDNFEVRHYWSVSFRVCGGLKCEREKQRSKEGFDF